MIVQFLGNWSVLMCPWIQVTGILFITPWWRHQMETVSALLALCLGNSSVTGEVPSQRPVTRSFDVFFDLRLNKRWSKQSWGWWFETPSCSLWRHCNALLAMFFLLLFSLRGPGWGLVRQFLPFFHLKNTQSLSVKGATSGPFTNLD